MTRRNLEETVWHNVHNNVGRVMGFMQIGPRNDGVWSDAYLAVTNGTLPVVHPVDHGMGQ